MKNKYLFYGLILFVMALITLIGKTTFTQPGISDLKGTYSEVATYRNETNTGPVIRIYAVYAADTLWKDMEAYGDFMPHTKYGNTKVFFFSDLQHTPDKITPDSPHFDKGYESYCVGRYEKTPMGEISMKKHPFK